MPRARIRSAVAGRLALLLGVALVPRAASALEVWVNQVGFDPAAPKLARVVDTTDHAGAAGT
ncbi:MAG TPA: hypothetical protein VGQ83_31330, partial [Polyangia bacterium]